METTIMTLNERFVKAQSEFKHPKMTAINPHFRSKYAPLINVLDSVIPALNKYGISVVQNPKTTPEGVSVDTILTHGVESWSLGAVVFPLTKRDAQGIMGAITYAKRCSLTAICCISGDEDDDGESAMDRTASVPAQKPVFKKPVNWLPDLLAKANTLEYGEITVKNFLILKGAWPAGCNGLEELPSPTMERLLKPDAWLQVVDYEQNGVPS